MRLPSAQNKNYNQFMATVLTKSPELLAEITASLISEMVYISDGGIETGSRLDINALQTFFSISSGLLGKAEATLSLADGLNLKVLN